MEKIKNGLTGSRRTLTLGVPLVLMVAFGGFSANAAGEGDVASYFGDLTSTITGTYIPAVITLALAGVAVFMGIRWVKKGASKS